MLGPVSAIRVFVRDVARARDFYERTLGLALRVDAGDALLFDTGSCTLIVEACDPDDEEGRALIGRFTGVSFEVPDIEAVQAALAARGARFDGPPETHDWGGRLTHFYDPDGNVLTLAQMP
jgi:catechol 2,3-dioxygenase-like lactoylglutathione lyase family enzyme